MLQAISNTAFSFFPYNCASDNKNSIDSVSHGPSAIAELLVLPCRYMHVISSVHLSTITKMCHT